MEWKKIEERYVLRIQRGEEIVGSITKLLHEQDIRAGTISGIGAASNVKLRYYSVEEQKYHSMSFEGAFEIATLTGNISVVDGKSWPHLHIVLTDTDYKAFGGHLESAVVGVTCEVILEPFEAEIDRTFDKETGLKLWKLTAPPERTP